MATLYTIGNINLKRVELVAKAIKETFSTVDIHKKKALEELKIFSQSIKDTLSKFVQILEENGAVVYMSGGDNIFAACTKECASLVAKFIERENKNGSICYSLSIGESIQDTYLGLKFAKCSKLHYIEVVPQNNHKIFQCVGKVRV